MAWCHRDVYAYCKCMHCSLIQEDKKAIKKKERKEEKHVEQHSKHVCIKYIDNSHPRRQNLTTSMVGWKHGHIHKNVTKNGEPQTSSWESKRRRRRQFTTLLSLSSMRQICTHSFFFFCVPQLYLWGSPLWGEIFAYVNVFLIQPLR